MILFLCVCIKNNICIMWCFHNCKMLKKIRHAFSSLKVNKIQSVISFSSFNPKRERYLSPDNQWTIHVSFFEREWSKWDYTLWILLTFNFMQHRHFTSEAYFVKAYNGVQSSMNLHMNYIKSVIGISENLESISWNHRIVEIQMRLHSLFTPTHPFCIVTYQKKERKTWISMQSLHTDAFSRFFPLWFE